eukprot:3365121-Alexandrium_andersonii.AAC.1
MPFDNCHAVRHEVDGLGPGKGNECPYQFGSRRTKGWAMHASDGPSAFHRGSVSPIFVCVTMLTLGQPLGTKRPDDRGSSNPPKPEPGMLDCAISEDI